MADDLVDSGAADTVAGGGDTMAGSDTQSGADTVSGGQDTAAGGDTLSGGDTQDGGVKGYWPDDWRTKVAGTDEKALKQLARFQSPADLFKSYSEAAKKIGAGAHKAADLPADATPDQVAEYRKERGIPEAPEGYLQALPDGLVIGDDDKPLVDTYLADAHAKNLPKEAVATGLDWYYRTKEATLAAQADADKDYKSKAEDDLRSEWGNEYRENLNSAMALLDTMPVLEDGTSVKSLFMGGRLADGTPIGNHPGVLRWLVSQSREINPAGFVAPSGGGSQIKSVEDEIASIEKVMRTDRKAYDKDTKMQDRLRQLYGAQEKLAQRA